KHLNETEPPRRFHVCRTDESGADDPGFNCFHSVLPSPDRGHLRPTFFLLRRHDRFQNGSAPGAVEEVGMHFRVGRNGVDEVIDRVNEGMLVANDVSGRPPGAEIGMRGLRAKNSFEAWFVGRIAAVAIFELIHALETKAERSFTPVDFPTVVVLMPGGQARGLKSPIGPSGHTFAGSKLRQKHTGIIHTNFFRPFPRGRLQPDGLRLARSLFDKSLLKTYRLGN